MAATTTPLASENWGWTPDFESGDRNRGDGFHPLSERGLDYFPFHIWIIWVVILPIDFHIFQDV